MRIIDRYLLRQFVQVFVICLCSVTGLYIVFDAFSNLDEFLRYADKQGSLFEILLAFYAYRSIYFFDRTSAILAMTAAMFTVTWIQRHHELTALMAAGIPRRRVVLPVVIAATLVSVVAAVSREAVIPLLAEELSRESSDPGSENGITFRQRYDLQNDFLFRGEQAYANEQRIEKPNFMLRETLDPKKRQLAAESAYWQPAAAHHPSGYLFAGVTAPQELLTEPTLKLNGRPVVITPPDAPWLLPDQCFVASEVDFDLLTGGMCWKQFSSTRQLIVGLANRGLGFGADVRVAIHSRLVQPFLDVTLLFLGLPLVLTRENRNMFVAIGLVGVVVVGFMVVTIVCQTLGAKLILDPALAAWLPLMIFVPVAVALFDRIDR